MNDSSLLRTIRLGSKSQTQTQYSVLRRFAHATNARTGLPPGSDPRWIGDELSLQCIPVERVPVRQGEPARVARVQGSRVLYLYDECRRERSWHLFVGLAMQRLARHPLAGSLPAAWQLAALIALPDEVVEDDENAHALPEDLHSFLPTRIIEARVTACARSGILVASLA